MKTIINESFKLESPFKSEFVSNKKLVNCSFDKCDFSEYRFTNCHFEDCVFKTCNLNHASIALNSGYKSGSFIRCLFDKCKLKATSFRFPVIDNCEFRNCVLNETDFDGSRFSNTKFIGVLDSCWFRGYSEYARKWVFGPFYQIDPKKVRNEMKHVDFSLAKLVGITFSHQIDLSNCVFPEGPEYVFVRDLQGIMNRAVDIINKTWQNPEEIEMAIGTIDVLYRNKDMEGQKNDFIDSFVHGDTDKMAGNDVGIKLFTLIKQLQEDLSIAGD